MHLFLRGKGGGVEEKMDVRDSPLSIEWQPTSWRQGGGGGTGHTEGQKSEVGAYPRVATWVQDHENMRGLGRGEVAVKTMAERERVCLVVYRRKTGHIHSNINNLRPHTLSIRIKP